MDTHSHPLEAANDPRALPYLAKPRYRRAALDFYPTHPAATRALLAHVQFRDMIWEPACGD